MHWGENEGWKMQGNYFRFQIAKNPRKYYCRKDGERGCI